LVEHVKQVYWLRKATNLYTIISDVFSGYYFQPIVLRQSKRPRLNQKLAVAIQNS